MALDLSPKYEKLQEVLGWAKDFMAETGYVAGSEKLTLARTRQITVENWKGPKKLDKDKE